MLIADLEDLEKLHASEIYFRRINAKEVLVSQEGHAFIFPAAGGTAKLSGSDDFRESTPRREQTVRSEDFSGELRGEPGDLNRQNQQRTLKPVPTFRRFKLTSHPSSSQ